jgi:Tol biopolymer transport system component
VTRLHALVFICLAIILAACSPAARESGEYKIALVPDLAGQHGIFVINSDQTGGRLLTPDPSVKLRSTSWSPDGKKIGFFAARDEDSSMQLKYRMPLHFPLYWMDSTGVNQKRLLDFPVSSFEFSRDGHQLLFVSSYEDPAHNDPDIVKGLKNPMSAVYLLDLRTGSQKRVTGFGQNCSGSWSPDGGSVALSFGDAQSSDLYTASLDGKHTRRLNSDSPGIKLKPAWSPDGKRIAYISFVSRETGMISSAYIVDADGSNIKQIANANPYEVSWSVDGKILLLRLTRGFALVSAEGNTIVDMENKVIQPEDAVFTPDGRGVMFRSNHEGPSYLYAVDLKGTNIRRISGRLSASMFCLSPLKP